MADTNKHLESLMHVTSFKTWVTLWALGAALAAVIVWSIFGSLPERIEGKGILQTLAGTQQITATGEGIVGELHIKEGDEVAPGDDIATVRSGRVAEEFRAAKARYDEAAAQHELNRVNEERNIAALQVQIGTKRGELKEREGELARQRDNLQKKIVPRDVVDNAQRAVDQVNTELRGLDIRIRSYRDSITQSYSQVEQARIALKRVEGTLTEVTKVTSTVVGRVTIIHRRPGDTVYPGQAIADVESTAGGDALEVVAYIAARNGKRVLPGQPVRLTLAGVPPAEFGYLQGEVTSVSQYPVSGTEAQRVLKEDTVSEASYVVKIAPRAGAEGRFLWIGGAGNDEKVLSGTSVTVGVQVSERTPYTLVLPLKKEDRVPITERAATVPRGSSN